MRLKTPQYPEHLVTLLAADALHGLYLDITTEILDPIDSYAFDPAEYVAEQSGSSPELGRFFYQTKVYKNLFHRVFIANIIKIIILNHKILVGDV